jgi:hypothetical protein
MGRIATKRNTKNMSVRFITNEKRQLVSTVIIPTSAAMKNLYLSKKQFVAMFLAFH